MLVLLVMGNPFQILFVKSRKQSGIEFDHLEEFALSLAFGAAIIPLFIMVSSLLGGLLNFYTSLGLLVSFLLLNLFMLRHKLRAFRPSSPRINARKFVFALVFILIFIFHFYPTLGLYVYPGDDGKVYSLGALRIIESGGYTKTWGPFVPSSWYQEIVHLIVAGFAGVCAYFSILTGLSVETTVMIITVAFMASMSVGVYFLAKRLLRSQAVALGAAVIFGIFIREPSIAPFSWGGNAELSSLFLLPIALGLFWETFQNKASARQEVLLAVLVAGMSLLHPFSAFYLVFAIIPYILYVALARREVKPILKSLKIVATSAMIIIPVIANAVIFEVPIMHDYESYPNPLWTPMFSWGQTPEQALYSVIWRFAAYYGIGSFLLLMVSVDVLRRSKIQKEPVILLALWMLTIFIVHENNPNGLWLIRFPLWYRIDTNRVFSVTSFAVSIIIGLGLYKLWKSSLRLVWEAKVRHSSFHWSSFKMIKSKKVLAMIALAATFTVQLYTNIVQNSVSQGNSSVTESDVIAFQWIQDNIPADAMIFVLPYDGGQWMPIYTSRSILIPFGVVTNITLQRQYYDKIYPAFAREPNASDVTQFFDYHKVEYIYIGAKIVLPELYKLRADPTSLLKFPFYRPVYNYSNVYIFKYASSAKA